MIQKNPFLKYLIKDENRDILHTSSYAKVQNGNDMGATSAESYAARAKIDQNRQRVKRYNDSRLVAGARAITPRAKTYEAPKKTYGIPKKGPSNSPGKMI